MAEARVAAEEARVPGHMKARVGLIHLPLYFCFRWSSERTAAAIATRDIVDGIAIDAFSHEARLLWLKRGWPPKKRGSRAT